MSQDNQKIYRCGCEPYKDEGYKDLEKAATNFFNKQNANKNSKTLSPVFIKTKER